MDTSGQGTVCRLKPHGHEKVQALIVPGPFPRPPPLPYNEK